MKNLFQAINSALNQGMDLVLCSIIASSGSTPRGSGAKMAVFADGSTVGTIGGGAVEYVSIQKAREALAQKSTFSVGYDLSPNETADIGMICGGKVVVYFQYFSGADAAARELFTYAQKLFETHATDSWLITRISDGGVRDMAIYERGRGLLFDSDMDEQIILPMLGANSALKKDEPGYFVEPLTQAGYVYVFGGGHVSQEVVPLLARVGFHPAVYEDRAEFASAALFPDAYERIVAPYADLAGHIAITKDDYVVILTRGHQADYEVLEQSLRSPACYVGVIGSRHKKAATIERLKKAGIADADIARIHNPIGLPIKGETPAEIAVSIAAELILHRAELRLERD